MVCKKTDPGVFRRSGSVAYLWAEAVPSEVLAQASRPRQPNRSTSVPAQQHQL